MENDHRNPILDPSQERLARDKISRFANLFEASGRNMTDVGLYVSSRLLKEFRGPRCSGIKRRLLKEGFVRLRELRDSLIRANRERIQYLNRFELVRAFCQENGLDVSLEQKYREAMAEYVKAKSVLSKMSSHWRGRKRRRLLGRWLD